MKKIRLIIAIAAMALLSSSCVLVNQARVPDHPYGTAPANDNGYHYPDPTAEVNETSPGNYVITWLADQRSEDARGAIGRVRVNGETVFNAVLGFHGGQTIVTLAAGEFAYVEVDFAWAEADWTVWEGWISHDA